MKKLIALFSILFLIACDVEDDSQKVHYEVLPIDTVEMPAEFHVDIENNINIKFLMPTSCHGFESFLYEKDGTTRTVAVQSYVFENGDGCTPLTNQIVEKTLKFKPTETGTFTFKFWKGKDSNGEDIFEEYIIDVII